MNNAKQITTIAILIAITSSIATYAWNNQTLSEMVEEHNQQILSDCLTKARIQKTTKEILDYASNCNKDLLTNLSTPRSVEVVTKEEQECIKNTPDSHSEDPEMIEAIRKCNDKYWTHSTGNTVQPLWIQLIPQASANSNVKNAETYGDQKSNDIYKENQSWVTNTVKSVEVWYSGLSLKIRTPKQIYEQVKHLGYREAPTISLISTCKASSWDPRHCILVWLVLMYNEAGNKQNSRACIDRNNCFGIKSWKAVYSSLDEWMENFVQKYNKWWINVKSAEDFYPDLWKLSKTRYCYSETQHHPNIGCPDGQKIAQSKWNQLYPLIYK